MCHTCKRDSSWTVPPADTKIFVSETARKSYNDDGLIIHNLALKRTVKKALVLVSATRLTSEKGEKKMVRFAQLLKDHNVPFIWFIFTDKTINNLVKGMVVFPPEVDVMPYMLCADYVVQLSESESFCYTIVEALQNEIPVLCSDLPVLSEIGFEDGENGYIIPDDMGDVDVELIARNDLIFDYKYDNKAKIKDWKNVLGPEKPFKKYEYKEVGVRVVQPYDDIQLKKSLKEGMRLKMEKSRAEDLVIQGLVEYDK